MCLLQLFFPAGTVGTDSDHGTGKPSVFFVPPKMTRIDYKDMVTRFGVFHVFFPGFAGCLWTHKKNHLGCYRSFPSIIPTRMALNAPSMRAWAPQGRHVRSLTTRSSSPRTRPERREGLGGSVESEQSSPRFHGWNGCCTAPGIDLSVVTRPTHLLYPDTSQTLHVWNI